MSKSSRLLMLFQVTVLLGAGTLYSALLTPRSFGLSHDDGIYLTTAKSLATGHGYRIISLPYEPAQTKYPPFYPFLLSLIWRIFPQFPQNLIPMMLLSVVATVALLGMSWRYLVKQEYATGWQALTVVALSALNWRMIILATAVYSEMVYAALSVVGLYLAEEYERKRKGRVAGLLVGVVSGIVFLTRSVGLALAIAIAAYYVLRRNWRRALVPVGVSGAFLAGWLVWCYLNKTNVEGVNVNYYVSYLRDFSEIIGELHNQTDTSKLLLFLGIIGKNILMFAVVSPPVICLDIDYDWPHKLPPFLFNIGLALFITVLLLLAAGFRRHISAGPRLLPLYLVFYLCLHVCWPYPAYDRFLMPVFPFFMLFIVTELGRLIPSVCKELKSATQVSKRLSAVFVGFVLIVLSGAVLYTYCLGIKRPVGYSKEMSRLTAEDSESIEWINKHTDHSDVLLCYRDPAYYLFTDRKGTRAAPMRGDDIINGRDEGVVKETGQILSIIRENNPKYLVLTNSDLNFDNPLELDRYQRAYKILLEQHPSMFVVVFESSDGRSRVYRIENDLR